MEEDDPMIEHTAADFLVEVISTDCSGLNIGLANITDVVAYLEQCNGPNKTKLRVETARYQRWLFSKPTSSRYVNIWLFPAFESIDCTLLSQLFRVQQALTTSTDVVITYNGINSQVEKQRVSHLLCMQHCDNTDGHKNLLINHYHGAEGVFWPHSLSKQRFRSYHLAMAAMVLLLTVTIMLFLLMVLRSNFRLAQIHTTGTTGLLQQLYLTASNVTEWKAHNDVSQWRLRLDDQSIIPLSMLDDRELKVQAWFEETFPVLKLNRDSGRYLDPEYLAKWDEIILDEKYHIAHCVAAVRRYLVAVETGNHICPKDVSLTHLKHCTQQLENFAFRSNSSWYPERGRDIMLKWHTDVCF